MAENAPFLPGLSPVSGKPVHLAFDGGRLTSDAGEVLLAEIEHKLRIAERLAGCIADPWAPERVRHSLVEMIRYRALLIAARVTEMVTRIKVSLPSSYPYKGARHKSALVIRVA